MAARSYLSRIAQPLTAADPVVWSTPRAAVDEARPATRAASPPPAPPMALHRPVPEAPPAISVADPAERASPSVAEMSLAAPIPRAARVESGVIAPRFATARDAPTTAAPRSFDGGAIGSMDSLDALDVPPSPVASPDRAAAAGDRVAVSGRVAPTASPTIDDIAAFATGAAAPAPQPTQAERRASSLGVSEAVAAPSVSVAPPRAGPAAAANAAMSDRPRLHIGAIEIRMTQPPAPPPAPPQTQAPVVMHAPPAVAAPLARGYASRFGLAQG